MRTEAPDTIRMRMQVERFLEALSWPARCAICQLLVARDEEFLVVVYEGGMHPTLVCTTCVTMSES